MPHELPDLEVLRPRAGAVVVVCTGEHDIATSRDLEQLLADLVAENDLVVVDVTRAAFIDSSFLHNIVKAERASRARGARLRLQVGTDLIVARALEVSGILGRIEHAHTREDALA